MAFFILLARERIKISRELISQEDMIKYGNMALNLLDNESWTVFFDYLTVIAILYFNDHHVDYIILETGIGGRYDSTNFIDNPALCIITSISLDHQRLLGCLLYTSPSPRDRTRSRMPSSA